MGDEELFSIDLDSSNEEHFDVRIYSRKFHFSFWNSWWIILNKEIFQHWYRSNQWSIGAKDEGDVAMVSQVWSKERIALQNLVYIVCPIEWNVKIDSWEEYCPKNEVEERIESSYRITVGHRVNWRGGKSFLHQSLSISMIKGFFSSLVDIFRFVSIDCLCRSSFNGIFEEKESFPKYLFSRRFSSWKQKRSMKRNSFEMKIAKISFHDWRSFRSSNRCEGVNQRWIDLFQGNRDEKISFPRSLMKEEKYVQDEFVHRPSDRRSVKKIIPMFDFDELKLRQKRWWILQNLFSSLILIRLIFLIESSRTKMRSLISWWSKSESTEISKRDFPLCLRVTRQLWWLAKSKKNFFSNRKQKCRWNRNSFVVISICWSSVWHWYNELHDGIDEKRTLATIGTHNWNSIKGNLIYDARDPNKIELVPLGKRIMKSVSEQEFDEQLGREAEQQRKLKNEITSPDSRSAFLTGEKKFRFIDRRSSRYLTLVENQPEFVFLADEDRQVISLPPLTNAERTKVSLFLSVDPSQHRSVRFVSVESEESNGVRRNHLEPFDGDLSSHDGNVRRRDLSSRSGREGFSRTADSPHATDANGRSEWQIESDLSLPNGSPVRPGQGLRNAEHSDRTIFSFRLKEERKENSLRGSLFVYLISDFRESNEFSSTTDVEFGISDRFNFVAQRSRTDRNAGRRNSSSDRIDPSASPTTTAAGGEGRSRSRRTNSTGGNERRWSSASDHSVLQRQLYFNLSLCFNSHLNGFEFSSEWIWRTFSGSVHPQPSILFSHLSLTCRNLHGDLLLGQYLSWKLCFSSSSLVESKSHSLVDQRRRRLFSSSLVESW